MCVYMCSHMKGEIQRPAPKQRQSSADSGKCASWFLIISLTPCRLFPYSQKSFVKLNEHNAYYLILILWSAVGSEGSQGIASPLSSSSLTSSFSPTSSFSENEMLTGMHTQYNGN